MILERLNFLQVLLDQIRQFEVLEINVEEFIAGQGKGEGVFAFAVIRRLLAAFARALRRFLDFIARREVLVAGKYLLPISAGRRVVEPRLRDPLRRDGDRFAFVDIRDAAVLDRIADDFLDLLARAAHEPLAIAEVLVLGVEASVYEVTHGGRATGPIPPCLPACTIRPAGGPGAPYSRGRSSGSRIQYAWNRCRSPSWCRN